MGSRALVKCHPPQEPHSRQGLVHPLMLGEDLAMNLDRIAHLVHEGSMPLIRTDFSSEDAWQRVVGRVSKESDFAGDGGGYSPNIEPVSDPGYESLTSDALASAWPRDRYGYVILADERSMREATAGDDLTVLFVDLSVDEEDEAELGWVFGRAFRCVASEVAVIEANLSIANMDFAEFADAADAAGVFRGL
jgi:hypothetical protein